MSEDNGKKNLGYQPANEQRGYQPTKSPSSSAKPPAPTNTPKGSSSGKKK